MRGREGSTFRGAAHAGQVTYAEAAGTRGMVEHQLRRRGIRDERVLEAMGRVPRELFVPDERG